MAKASVEDLKAEVSTFLPFHQGWQQACAAQMAAPAVSQCRAPL